MRIWPRMLIAAMLVTGAQIGAAQTIKDNTKLCAQRSAAAKIVTDHFDYKENINSRAFLKFKLRSNDLFRPHLEELSIYLIEEVLGPAVKVEERNISAGVLTIIVSENDVSPTKMSGALQKILLVVPNVPDRILPAKMLDATLEGEVISISLTEAGKAYFKNDALQNLKAYLELKLNSDDTTKASIKIRGSDYVELRSAPGVNNATTFREYLERPKRLVFAISRPQDIKPFSSGWELLPQYDREECSWVRVGEPAITTIDIDSSAVGIDELERPQINMTMNDSGFRKFAEFSRLSVERYGRANFAIVVDDVVMSSPYLTNDPSSYDLRFTGRFTEAEAQSLASGIGAYGSLKHFDVIEERLITD